MYPIASLRSQSPPSSSAAAALQQQVCCPTTAFTETIELNIRGIVELQQAKNKQAMQFFHSGLRVIHNGIVSINDSNNADRRECLDFLANNNNNNNDRKLLCSVALPKQDNLVAAHDDFFSLFNRALHMPLHRSSIPVTAGVPVVYCHLLTGILLYNIGLSHHLEALKKGNSKMMGKALDFYTMSYVTLMTKQSSSHQQQQLNSVPCSDVLNFVFMSLVNNMGHVHAYFRNIEEAKICGGELCKRLSPLVCACPGRPAISNHNDEYRVFFLNVCFFSESELASAPAA